MFTGLSFGIKLSNTVNEGDAPKGKSDEEIAKIKKGIVYCPKHKSFVTHSPGFLGTRFIPCPQCQPKG